jgi:DNA-damage-inducible protein D
MSEDIEHPDPATSPFDVYLHRRPDDEPYWCARELMPYLGYAKWERMADAL